MIDKIKALQEVASSLEPKQTERKTARDLVVSYTEDFLEKIYTAPTYNIENTNPNALFENPLSEYPESMETIIPFIKENVDKAGLNPASGGHLGYIPGGGQYYASLGDYIAAITNHYAGVHFAGQGAVQMENMLLSWVAKLVGYPKTFGGNHTSGGSIANLSAIVTARDAHHIKAKYIEKTVVYLSTQVHHCIDKALRIAGMGECIVRKLPLDKHYRIIPEELERMIQEDTKTGLTPWLIIASAGTTDVGAVDPLEQIGTIAKKHNCWFHVDAAYGGFFMLVENAKHKFKGIELSDSVVMDPHKGLFLPYGSGIVLVKQKQLLHQSHYYMANYMQDATSSSDEILSPAELSPELTKHWRGMRMWLPLKLCGINPFRACLEEKLLLTQYFYNEVQKLPGMETIIEPELSVATYRYVPETGDANNFNKKLTQEMHKDGRVFISSTMLDGKFTLRMAALSFRTHIETIDLLLEMLKEKIEIVKNG